MRSRASGLSFRRPPRLPAGFCSRAWLSPLPPRSAAQRARCAAAMRSRASGLILRRPPRLPAGFASSRFRGFLAARARPSGHAVPQRCARELQDSSSGVLPRLPLAALCTGAAFTAVSPPRVRPSARAAPRQCARGLPDSSSGFPSACPCRALPRERLPAAAAGVSPNTAFTCSSRIAICSLMCRTFLSSATERSDNVRD